MAATERAHACDRGGACFNCSCAHCSGVGIDASCVPAAAPDDRPESRDLSCRFVRSTAVSDRPTVLPRVVPPWRGWGIGSVSGALLLGASSGAVPRAVPCALLCAC